MRTILRLLNVASGLKWSYVAIVASSLLAAVATLAIPFIIGHATDVVVSAVSADASEATRSAAVVTVLWLALALFATDMFNTAVTSVGGYLGDVTATRLRHQLSARYYAHLLRLPQSYFDRELSGTVINRLNRSINDTTQFLNMFANNFFPMLLTIGGVLIVSAFYSWPLTVLLLIIYPVFTWLTALTSNRWQRYEREKNNHYDLAGGRFAEVIGQIKVVKSFASEQRELDHFRDHYDQTVSLTASQSRFWHAMDAARRGTLAVLFLAVYGLIFVQTIHGDYSVGTMVLLIQLVNMARQPVTMMSYLIDSSQRAIAGSRDYLNVLDEQPEPAVQPLVMGTVREPAHLHGQADTARELAPTPAVGAATGVPAIEFDQVTFGYDPSTDVLHEVSLTISQGAHVAVVSESGGGKSTLVSLLLGLYRPRSGHIRLFGQDIATMDRETLRRTIGVVFQEPALFSGTIAENVAYGNPSATREQIITASTNANADTFVTGLPGEYDAIIGERGLRLSGGQKQRIAVARAMLKDASILVLDEATSALDSKSERQVQLGLERLMAERTSLIIAHRLSTISRVDTIVTLDGGRVDEIGTPAELAESGGIYAELLALQASDSKRDRRLLARRYGMRA